MFLSKDDVERACSFLGIGTDEFIGIYCRRIDYGTYFLLSLKERDDYSCIFLDGTGCTIYPARPLQCSTYPFWRGLADDPEAIKAEMRNCPGIGKGRLYTDEEIRGLVALNDSSKPLVLEK